MYDVLMRSFDLGRNLVISRRMILVSLILSRRRASRTQFSQRGFDVEPLRVLQSVLHSVFHVFVHNSLCFVLFQQFIRCSYELGEFDVVAHCFGGCGSCVQGQSTLVVPVAKIYLVVYREGFDHAIGGPVVKYLDEQFGCIWLHVHSLFH